MIWNDQEKRRKKELSYEKWSREEERKEELDEWNENIIIQVFILMLKSSKVIWKYEWLNSELKSAKINFRMRKLEFNPKNSSFLLCYSELLLWYEKTRINDSKTS